MGLKVAIFVAFPAICAAILWKKEFYAVRGKIKCPSDPERVNGAEVGLYSEHFMHTWDAKMDRKFTDSSGCFELRGSGRKFFRRLDPQLYIWHYCTKKSAKPWCPNKNKLRLTKSKIYTESDNPTWNDVGEIDLENGQSYWMACGHKLMKPSTWGDTRQMNPRDMKCPWSNAEAPQYNGGGYASAEAWAAANAGSGHHHHHHHDHDHHHKHKDKEGQRGSEQEGAGEPDPVEGGGNVNGGGPKGEGGAPKGEQGPKVGPKGEQGPKGGPKGEQGPKGGAKGEQGPKGGAKGEQAPKGGAKGEQGAKEAAAAKYENDDEPAPKGGAPKGAAGPKGGAGPKGAEDGEASK